MKPLILITMLWLYKGKFQKLFTNTFVVCRDMNASK